MSLIKFTGDIQCEKFIELASVSHLMQILLYLYPHALQLLILRIKTWNLRYARYKEPLKDETYSSANT